MRENRTFVAVLVSMHKEEYVLSENIELFLCNIATFVTCTRYGVYNSARTSVGAPPLRY